MRRITRTLTSRARTTLPDAVRAALDLGVGDEIVYTVEIGRVILTKAGSQPAIDPFATFGEWAGDADRTAYGDL